MLTKTSSSKKFMLEKSSDCRFVDWSEFSNLLTGYKRLVRADDNARGLRGLFDLDSKVLYMIEQEKCDKHIGPT